jgi:hypothetical protein
LVASIPELLETGEIKALARALPKLLGMWPDSVYRINTMAMFSSLCTATEVSQEGENARSQELASVTLPKDSA